MNPAAASSAYDAVISAYYTVISIVIVYHLFAVQSWFDGVQTVVRDCISIERGSVFGDVKRHDAIDELEQVQKQFPWTQVAVLGIAIAMLGTLALIAASTASLPFLYWGTPTLVLWSVFVASSLASRLNGLHLYSQTKVLLLGQTASSH